MDSDNHLDEQNDSLELRDDDESFDADKDAYFESDESVFPDVETETGEEEEFIDLDQEMELETEEEEEEDEEEEDEDLMVEEKSYPVPQEDMPHIKVGITHGDFNGVSYEVILKTLADPRMTELFTPILYGSSKVASYYRKTFNLLDFNFNPVRRAEHADSKRVNLINIYDHEVRIEFGKASPVAGELSYLALEQAVADLKNKSIDVLVTAPINKKTIQSPSFNFPGHTEYLATKFHSEDYMMIMVDGNFRVGLITGHVPIQDVAGKITRDVILKKIRIFNQSLIRDFGVRKPRIAVLGLNPHAGEDGLLGLEEEEVFAPAIHDAAEENILVLGPYPADGFFGMMYHSQFDGILAAYHDQGLIPFKALSFDKGVNFTAGLPYVRTSPSHGTAYEIAGKNEASPDSFREAIFMALDIYRRRKEYEELTANPLQKSILVDETPETENNI
jgi:4-hydroxythreonine-4-phosphate dehydrogenase